MAARINQFFILGEGIDQEVITTDICRYLGNKSSVHRGTYEDRSTCETKEGYFIYAYRPPTSAQLADIRSDSAKWVAERQRELSLTSGNAYQFHPSVRTIEHLVPTKKDLPIYLECILCAACADFGAAANIIDASYARALSIRIIPDPNCEPFLLPTFGNLISPIGRARIMCAFPGEPDTAKVYDFFVFEHFVYPVIMGREFLRETGTLDRYQHRLRDRPVLRRNIPIIASLGADEETLTVFVNGEELDSIPDTGSEVNVMSLAFAQERGYSILMDDVHAVRFADGSTQDVIGLVTTPLSFTKGPPSGILLKLVDRLSTTLEDGCYVPKNTRQRSTVHDVSIAAEFYVLDGLNAQVILGEDLLASVNAFVFYGENFKTVTSPDSLYPALATIGLFKKAGKRICAALGRTVPAARDPLREQDIADSIESDRYERERERIRGLPEREQRRATRRNDRTREAYLRNRNRVPELSF